MPAPSQNFATSSQPRAWHVATSEYALPWIQKEASVGKSLNSSPQLQMMRSRLLLEQKTQHVAESTALKTERRVQEMADSIANMAHEIRTPLGAIIGLAHFLEESTLDENQKKCLATLQGCAADLMSMINRSLDIDKIESNVTNLEYTPFSMPSLLNKIVNRLAIKAQEKGIGLTLDYDMKLPQIFIGDSMRIQQILINLIGNAIKFTNTGAVTVSFADGGNEHGKKQISISVTDTGIGISNNKIKAIFSRFVQADSSIVSKFGGTGLGLSISKALAESMGGTIDVVSVPNEGSTFTLNLRLSSKNP